MGCLEYKASPTVGTSFQTGNIKRRWPVRWPETAFRNLGGGKHSAICKRRWQVRSTETGFSHLVKGKDSAIFKRRSRVRRSETAFSHFGSWYRRSRAGLSHRSPITSSPPFLTYYTEQYKGKSTGEKK